NATRCYLGSKPGCITVALQASTWLIIASALLVGVDRAFAQAADAKKPVSPQAAQFFEAKVRPVLAEHCFKCHGDIKKPKADLRLDSLAAMLTGGDQGSALAPGHPEKSLLIKAITYNDKDLKMPPAKKLSREQIADLTEWVKLGAPWPGSDTS